MVGTSDGTESPRRSQGDPSLLDARSPTAHCPERSRVCYPELLRRFGFQALRKLAGSDGGEERPVRSAGVEQRPDALVGEAAEPEGGAGDRRCGVRDREGRRTPRSGGRGRPCRGRERGHPRVHPLNHDRRRRELGGVAGALLGDHGEHLEPPRRLDVVVLEPLDGVSPHQIGPRQALVSVTSMRHPLLRRVRGPRAARRGVAGCCRIRCVRL